MNFKQLWSYGSNASNFPDMNIRNSEKKKNGISIGEGEVFESVHTQLITHDGSLAKASDAFDIFYVSYKCVLM